MHFYGGSHQEWLRLPIPVVRAYLKMIPVLRAKESLLRVEETAVGMGTIKKHDRDSILRAWRKMAGKDTPKRKTTLKDLVADGIKIVEVKGE